MINNIFFLVFISLFLSSCSKVNSTELQKKGNSSINFIKETPMKKGEYRAYKMEYTKGYLVLKNNCIYLTNKNNSNKNLRVVRWPWNYSLKSSKTGINIFDGKNQRVAKIGDFVKFRGFGGSFKNGNARLFNLFKACNGKNVIGAWYVSPQGIKR